MVKSSWWGGPREIIVTWDVESPRDKEYKRSSRALPVAAFSFFFLPPPWSKEIYWFLPVKLPKETLSPYVHTGYKSILPKSVVQIWNCSFSCFIAPAKTALVTTLSFLGWELIFLLLFCLVKVLSILPPQNFHTLFKNLLTMWRRSCIGLSAPTCKNSPAASEIVKTSSVFIKCTD